jgi:hypothetical protein
VLFSMMPSFPVCFFKQVSVATGFLLSKTNIMCNIFQFQHIYKFCNLQFWVYKVSKWLIMIIRFAGSSNALAHGLSQSSHILWQKHTCSSYLATFQLQDTNTWVKWFLTEGTNSLSIDEEKNTAHYPNSATIFLDSRQRFHVDMFHTVVCWFLLKSHPHYSCSSGDSSSFYLGL